MPEPLILSINGHAPQLHAGIVGGAERHRDRSR